MTNKTTNPPHLRNLADLSTGSQDYHLVIVADGTSTVAEITAETPVGHTAVSEGVAKRHRSDPKNNKLGELIAVQRAFAHAAERYGEMAAQLLEHQRYAGRIDGLQAKMSKKDRDEAKAVRRLEARLKFFAENGWDHESGATLRARYIEGKRK